MLIRFLGIATISVTFLTVQAMSSMDTSIANTPDRAHLSDEIITSNPTLYQMSLSSYEGARHLPRKADIFPLVEKQTAEMPPLPVRLRSNIDETQKTFAKTLKRKIKTASLNYKPRKNNIRHSYLPPSHVFESEVAENDSDAITTSAIETARLETTSLEKAPVLKRPKRNKAKISISGKKSWQQKAATSKLKSKKSKYGSKTKSYKKKVAAVRKSKKLKRYKKTNYMAAFSLGY